jgi:hypothetical protein
MLAVRLKEKTADGDYAYYLAPDGLRLVVAEEEKRRVIVTVLGPRDSYAEVAIPEMARELAAQLGSIDNPISAPQKEATADSSLEEEVKKLRKKVHQGTTGACRGVGLRACNQDDQGVPASQYRPVVDLSPAERRTKSGRPV